MDWSMFEREPGRSLERALLEDPDDLEAWTVYADFLAPHLPVLAERIMFELQHQGSNDAAQRELWQARVRDFDHQRRGKWLDARLRRLFDKHKRTRAGVELDWRYGFVSELRLDGGRLSARTGLDVVLGRVLESPLARFIGAVKIDCGERAQRERETVRAMISKATPRESLRVVSYRDEQGQVRADELLAWAPRIERLRMRGDCRRPSRRSETLRGLSMELRGARGREPLLAPQLRELELDYWRLPYWEREVPGVESLFEGAELRAVMRVKLGGRVDISERCVEGLRVAGVLPKLRRLELPGGISETIAALLLEVASAGRPLQLQVRVRDHELGPDLLRALVQRGVEVEEVGYRRFTTRDP